MPSLEAQIAEAVRLVVREELARVLARPEAPEPLTPREAARRLGVSLRTVQRMIRRGEVRSLKVGAARRVVLPGAEP